MFNKVVLRHVVRHAKARRMFFKCPQDETTETNFIVALSHPAGTWNNPAGICFYSAGNSHPAGFFSDVHNVLDTYEYSVSNNIMITAVIAIWASVIQRMVLYSL